MVRSPKPRYIAVEGPIGVGKSSLAEIEPNIAVGSATDEALRIRF